MGLPASRPPPERVTLAVVQGVEAWRGPCKRLAPFSFLVLNPFQARAFWRVFDHPAFALRFFADRIRSFEVLALARRLALSQERNYLVRSLGVRFVADAKNRINTLPRGQRRGGLRRR